MNPLICRRLSPARCDGDGCTSGLDTWPLHYVRNRGVDYRLCSSCLLLSYRTVYCCCCFLILGSAPPSHYDPGDPLLAPPSPTTTCLVCHEAVAHLSCLHSSCGVFVCPACSAATAGRPFSYAPSCRAPLDVRAARVVLLSTRMALALLKKEATEVSAKGKRMAEESAKERKQAYRALGIALGVDPKLPSTKEDIPPPLLELEPPENPRPEGNEVNMHMELEPPENAGPEGNEANMHMELEPPENPGPEGNEANMRVVLDLNEPPPPPSPATLTIGTETAMASAERPSSSCLATRTVGMEGGVCRGMAMASAEDPPPRTLQLFWKEKVDEVEDE